MERKGYRVEGGFADAAFFLVAKIALIEADADEVDVNG